MNEIIPFGFDQNPSIDSPDHPNAIFFKQSKETMIDTELYSRFIYSCENSFRKSRFYKDYKCFIMNLGIDKDQNKPAISSDMATIEMHHNLPTLKQGTIMITEHLFNVKGYATTYEVLYLLEEAHRNNWFDICMLSKTEHQMHHANPSDFISTKQCIGFPAKFIETYLDGMTLDISFKILLQLKLEEQYGESYNPMMVKAREDILSWQRSQAINYQQPQMFIPMMIMQPPVFN